MICKYCKTEQAKGIGDFSDLCTSCGYYTNLCTIEQRETCISLRLDHNHYLVWPDGNKWPGSFGRTFKIVMQDGREFETSNLWPQGKIPQIFWPKLPDNCVSITMTKDVDLRALGEQAARDAGLIN